MLWDRFRPSIRIVLLTVPVLFCGYCVLFMSCGCHSFVIVRYCLVIACWEGGGLPLGCRLWCLVVLLSLFVTFCTDYPHVNHTFFNFNKLLDLPPQ